MLLSFSLHGAQFQATSPDPTMLKQVGFPSTVCIGPKSTRYVLLDMLLLGIPESEREAKRAFVMRQLTPEEIEGMRLTCTVSRVCGDECVLWGVSL